jgi:hypothetical protein
MKKLLQFSFIILLSVVFSKHANAQDLPFEKTFKNGYNHTIVGVHKTPSGNFLVSTRSRPSLYAVELAYAFLFDSLGNQLWMKETMNPEFSVLWNYWENREEYIFYGPPFFCDWCATGYYAEWNFYRLDEQGNQLHNEKLNYYLAYQEPPPNLFQTMGYEYPQCLGSMLVENDAVIGVGNRFFQKVTNEGVLENYLAFSNDIIGIHQISKDEALAFGGNLIYTLNENGDLDSLLSLPFTVQKKDSCEQ